MFRLLIFLSPRLNEATCLVAAHACSARRRLPGPDYWISQPITSVTFYPRSDFSINKQTFHRLHHLRSNIQRDQFPWWRDCIHRHHSFCLLLMISVARIKMLRRVRVTLQVTCHSIQLWCAEDYNIIICIRPVYQPGSLHNAHVSHLIYKL